MPVSYTHLDVYKRQIWANTLHVSRSSLNQELQRMEEAGYFRIEGHVLHLLDRQSLEQFL